MVYLGREVEPQVAVVFESILDKQGHLAGQAKLDRVGQPASLAEVCEVLEREGEGNRLGHVNRDLFIRLVDAVVLPEVNGPGANVARAGELDSVF